MARLICAAVQLIIFTGLLCEQSTAIGVDYTVTVTVFGAQEQQVLEIPNIVQLQCTISPTPPFPVVYILSSSTQNHYLETSLFDAESRVGILIYERQPSIGRYFCHVLLASNRTTLAVGHITIFLSGILRPIESINKVFTPPAPLQMGVEIPPMFSHRRLLDSLRNITYEWKHNDTMLSDQVVNESSLVITPTSESDAGIYMVKIASFGLPNVTNEKCAAIILKHLTSYAIFQGVEFYAYNRLSYASYSTNLNGSGVEHSKSPHTMKEVLFVSGEPLRIDAIIQPQSYHIGVILQFQQVPLRLKLFYNGEQLPTNSQGGIKRPSEASSSFIRPTDELGVPVTFQLPMPTPEDEGLYEMQLFFEFDVSLLIPDCPDYVQLLQALDGLDFYETLIGSLTLMVHEQGRQGRPKVIIEATEQVISANSIESPPILTCSVVKDGNLIPANQIRWKKGYKTLAQTRVSETLILDTATNDNPTIFGMYTCEAIIDQNKSTAKRSILITERAHFKMEISPINSTRCLDLSEETMLDILLMELQLFSFEMDADFTGENFANFSLDCSYEGNSIAISTDVTYSNSDGSITASVLVETAEAWMNGIRTANGATFLIARPGPSPDTSDVSQHGQQGPGSRDIAVIILSILVFGLLVAGVVILSLLCVQRKYYKKKDIHQQNPLPLKRESVIINNSEITTSEPQTQILPTSISYDQLIEAQRSGAQLLVYREGKTLHSARVVPKAHTEVGRAIHLTNTQEVTADKPVTYTLLSLRPNHAYKRRKDALDEDSINQQGQTILTTHDGLNQNRMSVHYYDYPKVQKDGDTDSLGYQSINDLI